MASGAAPQGDDTVKAHERTMPSAALPLRASDHPVPSAEDLRAQARHLPLGKKFELIIGLLDDLVPDRDRYPPLPVWDLSEPGVAVYGTLRFPISGAPRRILARLVDARGAAVRLAELKEAAGNDLVLDTTLRTHLSDLRKALRAGLADLEDFPADPIPCVDRGEAGGYRLAVW
jgi:hypothetical protein